MSKDKKESEYYTAEEIYRSGKNFVIIEYRGEEEYDGLVIHQNKKVEYKGKTLLRNNSGHYVNKQIRITKKNFVAFTMYSNGKVLSPMSLPTGTNIMYKPNTELIYGYYREEV